jgi:hypothetical protein
MRIFPQTTQALVQAIVLETHKLRQRVRLLALVSGVHSEPPMAVHPAALRRVLQAGRRMLEPRELRAPPVAPRLIFA